MLHKMAFQLSGKFVALHLDNSTANAYLFNWSSTASFFISRVACCILILADKHGITLIPAYIPTHLNVEADYLSQGRLVQEWYLLPCIAQAAFQLWGQLEMDLLVSSHTNQYQHYYTMKNPLPFLILYVYCTDTAATKIFADKFYFLLLFIYIIVHYIYIYCNYIHSLDLRKYILSTYL